MNETQEEERRSEFVREHRTVRSAVGMMYDLNNRFDELVLRQDITDEQLARLLGVSPDMTTVTVYLEHGRRPFSWSYSIWRDGDLWIRSPMSDLWRRQYRTSGAAARDAEHGIRANIGHNVEINFYVRRRIRGH